MTNALSALPSSFLFKHRNSVSPEPFLVTLAAAIPGSSTTTIFHRRFLEQQQNLSITAHDALQARLVSEAIEDL